MYCMLLCHVIQCVESTVLDMVEQKDARRECHCGIFQYTVHANVFDEMPIK